MKLSSLGPVVLLLAAGAEARNCKQGLQYCGTTLTNIGALFRFRYRVRTPRWLQGC